QQDAMQRPHQGHTTTGQPPASGQQQTENETQAGHGQHAGHDKAGNLTVAGGAHAGHDMTSDMMATVTGGPFRSMRALGSGTALQPVSTPMYAWMFMSGGRRKVIPGGIKVWE